MPETGKKGLKLKRATHFRSVLNQPNFLRYTAVNTLGFCAIFAYLSTSSGLLIDARGLDPSVFSFWIAANAVFNTLGCVWAARLLKTASLEAVMILGAQLIAAGGVGIVCLGFWDATLAFMAPMFVLSLGVSLIMPASAAAAMEPFDGETARAAGFWDSLDSRLRACWARR